MSLPCDAHLAGEVRIGFRILRRPFLAAALFAAASVPFLFGCDRTAVPKLITSIECTHPSGKVRFSPDGAKLVVDDGDGLIVWDVNAGRVKAKLNNVAKLSHDFVFTSDGKHVLLADRSIVRLLDLDTGNSTVLYRHEEDVDCLAYSRKGEMVASSEGSDVRIWDIGAAKEITRVRVEGFIGALVFSPDGKTLIGAGGKGEVPASGSIWLWDVAGQQKPRVLKGYAHPVSALALSPDGKTLATPGESKDVKLWDLQTDTVKAHWKAGFKVVSDIAFSSDGRTLLVAGGDGDFLGERFNPGKVSFFDTGTGRILHSFAALEDSVRSIALSPDGTKLAVSHHQKMKTVKIWEVSSVARRPQ